MLVSISSNCIEQNTPVLTNAAPTTAAELLPIEIRDVKSYGQGPETSSADLVPVEGQPFREALRLTTFNRPLRYWDYGSTIPLTGTVRKGDVLWVSLWARRLTSRKESVLK